MAPPPLRPRFVLPIVGLLLVAHGLGPARPAAAKTAGSTAVFACFEKGWRNESPAAVADCVAAKGTARFALQTYPLSGKAHSLKPAQVRASLSTYFEKISGVGLVDVTPRKGPANVRLYDYTYKPAGENARTTHLQVRLRRDEKRRWVLASVTESVKRRG